MLSTVVVEYYGAPTPLQSLATVSAPDAQTLMIKPFDKGSMQDIERAIMESGLGFNPNNDGEVIRINVPQLTEERRKEMVKLCNGEGENAKVRAVLQHMCMHAKCM
jgi:ribosome recycling factor